MHAACAPARTRPALELADVVRAYGPAFVQSRGLRPEQRAALRDIERCRTAVARRSPRRVHRVRPRAALVQLVPQSTLPQVPVARAGAGGSTSASQRLLPVHYFHVVFTLPAELRAVARRHRERSSTCSSPRASATLLDARRAIRSASAPSSASRWCCTPGRASSLFHPHVHAIVTGGGLSDDDARWVPRAKGLPLPGARHGRALSRQDARRPRARPRATATSTSPASTSARSAASPGSSTPSDPSADPSR